MPLCSDPAGECPRLPAPHRWAKRNSETLPHNRHEREMPTAGVRSNTPNHTPPGHPAIAPVKGGHLRGRRRHAHDRARIASSPRPGPGTASDDTASRLTANNHAKASLWVAFCSLCPAPLLTPKRVFCAGRAAAGPDLVTGFQRGRFGCSVPAAPRRRKSGGAASALLGGGVGWCCGRDATGGPSGPLGAAQEPLKAGSLRGPRDPARG